MSIPVVEGPDMPEDPNDITELLLPDREPEDEEDPEEFD